MLRTIWEIIENNINERNCGIFQNEMSYITKFFDPDNIKLVVRAGTEIKVAQGCQVTVTPVSSDVNNL